MDGHDGHDGVAHGSGIGHFGGHSGDLGHAHGHSSHGGHDHHSQGGKTTASAIMFSHSHDSHAGQPHFTIEHSSTAHASAHAGVTEASVDRQGQQVTFGGMDGELVTMKAGEIGKNDPPATRTFLVRSIHHSLVDFNAELARMAKKLGVIRLDNRIPNFDGAYDKQPKLMSYHAWVPAAQLSEMPDGYREGFTGETTLVRQLWGIAKWDRRIPGMGWDREAKVVIEVAITCWRFLQTGTYETKMTFRLVSLLNYSEAYGRYAVPVKSFNAHQAAALTMAKAMNEVLKAARPDEGQFALLAFWDKNQPDRPFDHPDGITKASPEDEQELENASVGEVEESDTRVRIDTQGSAPAPAPSSGGGGGGDDEEGASLVGPVALVGDHRVAFDLDNVLPVDEHAAATAPEQVWVKIPK